MELLKPLFWTSGDTYSGFLSHGGSPQIFCHVTCKGIHRFISSATSADLFVASMAAKPFHPRTGIQALVGLEFHFKSNVKSGGGILESTIMISLHVLLA